jgi:hypothetical protein
MFSRLGSFVWGLGPPPVLVLSGLAPLWVKGNGVVKFRAAICATIDKINEGLTEKGQRFRRPRAEATIEYEERNRP